MTSRRALTEKELATRFKLRSSLIINGLNRKYKQKHYKWTASLCADGDIHFVAGIAARIMPRSTFYDSASVLDLWDYIEEHWNLISKVTLKVSDIKVV